MRPEAGKPKKKDKQLLWRIHHWSGVYAGILIGVLCITGVLAVFISEIDALVLNYHYRADVSKNTKPGFGKAVDSLLARYPGYNSLSVRLPDEHDPVAHADLIVKEAGKRNRRYDFFIDTGSDRVIGERDHQNSLANYLRQMHVRLYEGNWGRQLVGLGGVALVVVTVTGLLIYGNFMKKQTWPDVRQNLGTRIVMADWHKLLGISALAFNLVIAVTGAWLGLQPWFIRWFDLSPPNAFEAPVVMEPETDKSLKIRWHEILPAVQREFPDLQPRYIMPSTNGEGTLTVRGNIAGLAYERDINILVLSKTDHKPLYKYDVRHQPFGHKLYFVQEALHFGDFGGLLLKLLYAVLGLVSGFLSVSGYVVYLYRRKKQKQLKADPGKLLFVYCMLILLFLVGVAFISLFVGYTQAATVAAWIINTLLIGLLLYGVFRLVKGKSASIKIRQPHEVL